MKRLPIYLLVLLPLTAHGQAPEALSVEEKNQRTRELVNRGGAAFEREDYEVCAKMFREAYDLAGIPQIRFNLGVCLQRLERYREASIEFEAAALSTENDANTRKRAREELRKVRAKLGTARIDPVDGFDAAWIDGEIRCAFPCAVPLDPGEHEAVVGSGDQRRTGRFTVHSGKIVLVRFAPALIDETSPDEPSQPIRWMRWTGIGVASVGTIGTVGFGIRTFSLKEDFDAMPTQELKNDGEQARTLTYVSLGVAITGAALLVYDLVSE